MCSGVSDGNPVKIATLVSLSRKISFDVVIELESIESPLLRAELRVDRCFLPVFPLRPLGAGKHALPLIVVVDVVGLRVKDKLAG